MASDPSEQKFDPKFEKTDANAMLAGVVGLLAILSVWVLMDAVGSWIHRLKGTDRGTTGAENSILVERGLPPLPRLQEDPEVELDSYLEKEDALLGSYGWVDKRAGIARIPIARAMEILSHEKP